MPDSPESNKETVRPLPPLRPPVSPMKAELNLSPDPASSFYSGPRNETARITGLSHPPKPSASAQMEKTQPLISRREVRTSIVPIPLCWVLLVASSAILLIQIWNYIS
jgi:hypothetical protein